MVEAEDLPAEILNWNVLFLRGNREHWWDWLTPPEWRHVCAYGYAGNGQWVVYDVADIRSRICVLSDLQFDHWLNHYEGRIKAVVQIPTGQGGGISARLGFWCVTAIKHLVALPSSALRPKALFRDLKKHNGKVILHDGGQS